MEVSGHNPFRQKGSSVRQPVSIALPFALILGAAAQAKDTSYIGSVQAVPSDTGAEMARGTVFLDANRNSTLDEGEAGVSGVLVSNGREVVATSEDGTCELPVYGDMIHFITKPASHATPVDDFMVPQSSCIHKEEGSPDLRFGGIGPVGSMPQAVNFQLIEDNSAIKGDQ